VSSFGEGLKREREKKKIALDQVSASTKISVRMLRAIEEEKFDQLPGGIFNKGFVRAYARHLGLDEEKAVADYLAASAPVALIQPEDLELRAMAEQKGKERQRQASLKNDFPWGSIAALLLVVALGFSIWGVISGRESQHRGSDLKSGAVQPPQPETTATPVAQVATTAAVPKPQVATKTAPATNAKPPGSTTAKTNTFDDNEPEVTTRHLSVEGFPSPSGTPAPLKLGTPLPTRAGSFTLLVSAQENCWVSIMADGKSVFTGTLTAPESHLVHATDSIVLRAGNLGGLEFDFNGKRLPPQGGTGEAKTLTFRADGLEPPKASPLPEAKSSSSAEPAQNPQ